MGRIIVFTGKGGTGKTSIAAAHAAASAREGKNTLFVSADMAHNLGDIFEIEAGNREVQVREHLYLLELDPEVLMRDEYPDVNHAILSMVDNTGYSQNTEVGFMIPGFENLFSLLKIKDIYESGVYDRIIVDCAPTGETLSLLKLPELLAWYVEKFSPVGRMMVRVLTPISKLKYKVSLPSTKELDDLGKLYMELIALQSFLKDPGICSIRLVCIPEKMVVEETKRNYMYLNLYEYHVDGLFINRVLPEDTGSDFMNHWRDAQKKYIDELERVFTEIPLTKILWYSNEIKGNAAIDRLMDDLCQVPDLFALIPPIPRDVYEETEEGYCLSISLPQATDNEVEVTMHQNDIDVKVNNFNRCIPLPNILRNAEVMKTECVMDRFRIYLRCHEGNSEVQV